MLPANPQLFRNPFKATSEVLVAAKAALKGVVPRVVEVSVVVPRAPLVESAPDSDVDNKKHSYAALARGIYSSKERILFPGASKEGTIFLP